MRQAPEGLGFSRAEHGGEQIPSTLPKAEAATTELRSPCCQDCVGLAREGFVVRVGGFATTKEGNSVVTATPSLRPSAEQQAPSERLLRHS
jgi:hypothetical protein